MLRARRRLLTSSGRLAFFTISIAPDLSRADRRIARAAGPPAVAEADTVALLSKAGFARIRVTDATPEYLTAARGWLTARTSHGEALRAPDPVGFDQRMAEGRAAVDAIATGLLRRALFVAAVPARRDAGRDETVGRW